METLLAAFNCSNLSLRTEYRYAKFGTENIPIGITVAGNVGLRSRLSGQTATLSLCWTF